MRRSPLAADYQIVKASLEHAEDLAPRMRGEDVAEVWAASHLGPLEALQQAVETSALPLTWLVEGRPAAMWGAVPVNIIRGVAIPWLLGTRDVERHAMHFARTSRRIVAELRGQWPILVNFVDQRHEQSVRWLRWLGADLAPATPFGPDGLPFHRFAWMTERRSCVTQ